MSWEDKIREFFPKLKMICTTIAVFLAVWIFSHLFIRSCGGPFPHRIAGPLAKEEYIEKGRLPEWENMLFPKDGEGDQTHVEMMMEGLKLPELEFEYPVATPKPAPAEDSIAPSTRVFPPE